MIARRNHTRAFAHFVGMAVLACVSLAPFPVCAEDDEEAERPRPKVLVLVDGGPDDRTLFRGWPVLVHAAIIADESRGELTVRGPSTLAPVRCGDVWVVPAAATVQLPAGEYIFAIGSGATTVVVTDPPAQLSPELLVIRRRVSIRTDIALGNTAAAIQTAREWIATEPKSPEAHTLLGDAYLAAGQRAEAAESFNRAVRFIPPYLRAPGSLVARGADVWDGAMTVAETQPEAGNAGSGTAAMGASAQSASADPAGEGIAGKVSTGPGQVVPAGELNDAVIQADPAGQWASSATAGSQYGNNKNYAAAQATGAPNIAAAGNSPAAWCPAGKNNGTDWLEVTFAKPVHATEVRIRQNDTAGAIAKIEAITTDGTTYPWWEGTDPYAAGEAREIVWFAVRVPKTDYAVARIRITLNLAAVAGWKEIDAVQLVGE